MTVIATFFINFQEFVDPNDQTLVIFPLPSSIVALKNKLIKIKYFAVDFITTTSFLYSPELTLQSPYLSNLTASYVPFKNNSTSFQDFYSINSNIMKLTFKILSNKVFQPIVDQINAYTVIEVIA
jgi:hypothetical protein